MNKRERVALAIKEVVSKMMDRVMENVLVNDPFITENIMQASHSTLP